MGRATILEHMGSARYRVNIHRDSPRVTARISTFRDEADTIDTDVASRQADLAQAEAEMLSAKSAYEQDQATIEGVSELLPPYLQALAVWEGQANYVLGMQEQATRLREKADTLEAATATREALAWCAWYVEDLTIGSTVATMEVARQGEDFPNHVIYPDGREPTKDDGQMRSIMSMTAAQTYLNYAVWPGAVKWQGRYALGYIISNDMVGKQAMISYGVANTAGIYQHRDIETLPYDDPCPLGDGLPGFATGDRVMVLVDEADKRIVGWAEWPRPCGITAIEVSFSFTRHWNYYWSSEFREKSGVFTYEYDACEIYYAPGFGPNFGVKKTGGYSIREDSSPDYLSFVSYTWVNTLQGYSGWPTPPLFWRGYAGHNGKNVVGDGGTFAGISYSFVSNPWNIDAMIQEFCGLSSIQGHGPYTAANSELYQPFELSVAWTQQMVDHATATILAGHLHYVYSRDSTHYLSNRTVVTPEDIIAALGTSASTAYVVSRYAWRTREDVNFKIGLTPKYIEDHLTLVLGQDYLDGNF